ncbi:MAG: CorA family divalent cation transporter [Bdellovibrionales bacterium]
MPVTKIEFHDFHWLDIGNPTAESLEQLAKTYELHPTSVQDCLQPEHLPKHEVIQDTLFVVLRAYDTEAHDAADTVQELTRKLAIFYTDRFVITIHRKDHPFIDHLIKKWQKRGQTDRTVTPEHILGDLLNEVVKTYQAPVMACIQDLEEFETEIFGAGTSREFRIQSGYYLRRKASVFKRMLRSTLEPLTRVMNQAESDLLPHFQNARDLIDNLYFYAEEITESLSSLLNLHISLASQKTNEASLKTNDVMQVLTIFNCFFLPVNFIASIYGMNFSYMPETRWEYGYFATLGLMATIVSVIFLWFRRKGWLHRLPAPEQ